MHLVAAGRAEGALPVAPRAWTWGSGNRFGQAAILSIAGHAVLFGFLSLTRVSPAGESSGVVELQIMENHEVQPVRAEMAQGRATAPEARKRHAARVRAKVEHDVEAPSRQGAPPQAAPMVGMSPRSTTAAGTFAVAVGDTLFGPMPRVARDGSGSGPAVAPAPVVRAPPKVKTAPRIPYPQEAALRGVQGSVVMRVAIDASGRVTSVGLIEGAGGGLDEAAMAAMRAFRFEPATEDGKPVASEIRYTYRFALK